MREVSILAAGLMAAAMRTAPKAGGKDFLEIVVVSDGADLARIAEAMREFAPRSTNEAFWLRDADNIAACHAVVLVGLRSSPAAGYDCGACGHESCKAFIAARGAQPAPGREMGYGGPHCAMRIIDIGCALSSAAKAASLLSIDNRVQQRVGAAARALGLIDADLVMGVPVGIFGKSIFHDRQPKK